MARTLTLTDPQGKLEPLVTPCLIITTEMGMIPNVTPDISPNVPLYFSLGDFIENNLPKNVKIPTSLGLGPRWIFLGPGTNFNNFDDGPSAKGIKIYCRNGNSKTVSKDDYQTVIDSIQPQGIISLYSSIMPESSSRQKKLRETAANDFSTQYPNAFNFTSDISDKDDSGVFFHFGDITDVEVEKITDKISRVPADLPRMIMCDGHPADVRKLYSLGVDLFVLHMPYLAAKRGIAMNFDFHEKEFKNIGIDLKSKEFEHDHNPVCQNCDCICCQQFTRSYLYHLLEVHEMLAGTLLVQHNTRHYQRYLESLCEEYSQ